MLFSEPQMYFLILMAFWRSLQIYALFGVYLYHRFILMIIDWIFFINLICQNHCGYEVIQMIRYFALQILFPYGLFRS